MQKIAGYRRLTNKKDEVHVSRVLSHTLCCLVILTYMTGCGQTAPKSSEVKTVDLSDQKAGRRWRLDFNEIFVQRKECLSILDCTTTKEALRLPIAMYDYRVMAAYGVLPLYRGSRGAEEIARDASALELQLENAELKPDSRDAIREALNYLTDQTNQRASGQQIISDILGAKIATLRKDSDGSFEKANAAFEDQKQAESGEDFSTLSSVLSHSFPKGRQCDLVTSAFIDSKSDEALVWMPIELPEANWFDANEVPRENDAFGDADRGSDPQRGCRAALGPAWRLPTQAEVIAAIDHGIRRHISYTSIAKGWKEFWTSESYTRPTTRAAYGISASFDDRQPRQKSRWDTLSIVCVAKLSNETAQVRQRYFGEKTELPSIEAPTPEEGSKG